MLAFYLTNFEKNIQETAILLVLFYYIIYYIIIITDIAVASKAVGCNGEFQLRC